MAKPAYVGPIGMDQLKLEDWYLRFFDVMHLAMVRHAIVTCHPDHSAFMTDMLEKLSEDLTWMTKHGDHPIPLNLDERVPVGNYTFWRHDVGLIATPEELVKSKSGFGRHSGFAMPSKDGVKPWSELNKDAGKG